MARHRGLLGLLGKERPQVTPWAGIRSLLHGKFRSECFSHIPASPKTQCHCQEQVPRAVRPGLQYIEIPAPHCCHKGAGRAFGENCHCFRGTGRKGGSLISHIENKTSAVFLGRNSK